MKYKCAQAGVQITERDLKILQKLNASGWLAAGQIRNYFFPGKSVNAVSKRLRKLVRGKYLAMAREGPTEPGYYRLASRGKLALIEQMGASEDEVTVSAQFPRNLHHFVAVNTLRYCFEQIDGREVQLHYFFGERELWRYDQKSTLDPTGLLPLLKHYHLIPDAIAKVGMSKEGVQQEFDLLIEYDAGTEHASFFARTKVRQYVALVNHNRERLGEVKIFIFAPTVQRLVRLMRQAVYYQPPPSLFYFAPTSALQQSRWWAAGVFLDPNDFFLAVRQGEHVEVVEIDVQEGNIPRYSLLHLPASSPQRVSPREERARAGKAF